MYTNDWGYAPWQNGMHANWHPYPGYYYWYPCHYNGNLINWNPSYENSTVQDHGQRPFVVNIDQAAKRNTNYRTAIWTGQHLQVTLMSINPGDDIGLEVHPTTDQFIRIEEGEGLVQMGARRDNLDFQRMAYAGYAVMVPAGTWHNVINTGKTPLKVYSIYAPPEHPFGTVHETKAQAMAAENHA